MIDTGTWAEQASSYYLYKFTVSSNTQPQEYPSPFFLLYIYKHYVKFCFKIGGKRKILNERQCDKFNSFTPDVFEKNIYIAIYSSVRQIESHILDCCSACGPYNVCLWSTNVTWILAAFNYFIHSLPSNEPRGIW